MRRGRAGGSCEVSRSPLGGEPGKVKGTLSAVAMGMVSCQSPRRSLQWKRPLSPAIAARLAIVGAKRQRECQTLQNRDAIARNFGKVAADLFEDIEVTKTGR